MELESNSVSARRSHDRNQNNTALRKFSLAANGAIKTTEPTTGQNSCLPSLEAATTSIEPAQAQEQQRRSLWNHNGSVVYLVANGQSRLFYYKTPRLGVLKAGARADDLLFSGTSHDGSYFGIAHMFHPRCGNTAYEVSGPILDNSERVLLKGIAPRFGPSCEIIGRFTDTLEFTLLKGVELGSISAAEPAVSIPDLNGLWQIWPIGTDDRQFEYQLTNGTISINAIDLACKITNLRPQPDGSFVGAEHCAEESFSTDSIETFKVVHVNQDILLVGAGITKRSVDMSSDARPEETYHDRPSVITLYKKLPNGE